MEENVKENERLFFNVSVISDFWFLALLCFHQCKERSEVEVNLLAASLFSYLEFLTGEKAFGRIFLLRSGDSTWHMGIIKMWD